MSETEKLDAEPPVDSIVDLATAAEIWRTWQGHRTERLNAYAVQSEVLFAAMGFPVRPFPDQAFQMSLASLDDDVRDASKSALLAILVDVRRIAESGHIREIPTK